MLEAVDVHEQHRKAVPRVAAGVANGLLQARQHHLAVGQLGQHVGAGWASRCPAQRLVFAGVDADTHKAREHAVAVTQRAQVHVQPQVAPGARAVRACLAQAGAALQRLAQAHGVVARLGRAVQTFGTMPARHVVQPPARQLREGGVDPFDAVLGIADQHHRAGVLGHTGLALQVGVDLRLAPGMLGHGAHDGFGDDDGQQQQRKAQRQGAQQRHRQRQRQKGAVEPAPHAALQGQVLFGQRPRGGALTWQLQAPGRSRRGFRCRECHGFRVFWGAGFRRHAGPLLTGYRLRALPLKARRRLEARRHRHRHRHRHLHRHAPVRGRLRAQRCGRLLQPA